MRRTRMARERRQGFTLIEVMISLGIMTIGAMAMLALQQQTIRANSQARQITTATQIAQLWIERLKEDGTRWTQVGFFNTPGQPTAADVLALTTYLGAITTAPNVFQAIPNATPQVSNAFDFQGNDIANNSGSVYYCASFRPAWVYFGRAMRVDVRVWWARSGSSLTGDFAACADDNARLNPGGTLFNNYHVVYLPTVIRVNTAPR